MRMPFSSTSVWPKFAPRMEMSDCTPLAARSRRSTEGSSRSTSIQLFMSSSYCRRGSTVTERSSSSSVRGSHVPVTTMESARGGGCCAGAICDDHRYTASSTGGKVRKQLRLIGRTWTCKLPQNETLIGSESVAGRISKLRSHPRLRSRAEFDFGNPLLRIWRRMRDSLDPNHMIPRNLLILQFAGFAEFALKRQLWLL